MAQPYVGEIRMFAGNFAPAGWMFCEGQLLPISENETLFQLIGIPGNLRIRDGFVEQIRMSAAIQHLKQIAGSDRPRGEIAAGFNLLEQGR